MLWSRINLDCFKNWVKPFLDPNHLRLPSLLPIIKSHYVFVSTRIQLAPCSYELLLNSLRIQINSHSFYTKTYGKEPCHALPVLWCITLLPSPDVRFILDENLLRVIISVVPVISRDIPFLFLWYQSYFACVIFVFCGSSTHSCGEWVNISVFYPLTAGYASLYDNIYFTMFKLFNSSYITPAILSLVLFLSASFS